MLGTIVHAAGYPSLLTLLDFRGCFPVPMNNSLVELAMGNKGVSIDHEAAEKRHAYLVV